MTQPARKGWDQRLFVYWCAGGLLGWMPLGWWIWAMKPCSWLLFKDSALVTLGALPLLLLYGWWRLELRRWDILALLALVGFFNSLPLVCMGGSVLNRLGGSREVLVEVPSVVRLEDDWLSQPSMGYFATIKSDAPMCSIENLELSQRQYEWMRHRPRVLVRIGEGWLGWRWLEEIVDAPP